jgi:acetate kinase
VAVADPHAAAECALRVAQERTQISLVGHRVVYGGTLFPEHRRIDAEVKAAIRRLSDLAPLHNPPALAAIEAAEAALPGIPQVAVFDTMFFAQLPPRAYLYPLPYEWHERFGLRRIGFHGISNAFCLCRAAELLGREPGQVRLITCHLGGGCSATAVRNGHPVNTTMGFSPLDGLMMGSRPGSLDPGLLLHLQRTCGLTFRQIDHALNHRSGLLGISGLSADLAQIETAADAGNVRARWAFEMFADRVRGAIGSLAVTLGGLDALVFTDRMGEGSPALRSAVCQGLECLGLHLDPQQNTNCQADADIATAESAGRILVLRTREELMIARESRRVIAGDNPRPA